MMVLYGYIYYICNVIYNMTYILYMCNCYLHNIIIKMSEVEIQDYRHINFKTCKTILCVPCIYIFKSIEIINTQIRWELSEGETEGEEGKA